MIGCTYLERGAPVVVLTRWRAGGGPRNVLIRRADGSEVVRPFRGLRLGTESARTKATKDRRARRKQAKAAALRCDGTETGVRT